MKQRDVCIRGVNEALRGVEEILQLVPTKKGADFFSELVTLF
jgi:hypothetical protein